MAKELLLGAEKLMLPEWSDGDLIIPASELSLDEHAAQEVRLLDGQMRPDIQVGGKLGDTVLPLVFVEIKVSHAVDWKKAAIARQHGISMFEIDLSKATDEQAQDYESFVAMVLRCVANRAWVNLGDPKFIAASLGQEVFEVRSTEIFRHEVPTKKGGIMYFSKQRAVRHRVDGESKPIDFEIADTYLGGQRIDGLGNNLPYEPGLYVRASPPPTAWFWQVSNFYKTYLRLLTTTRRKQQTELF